jgi:hypothetical protein
MLVDIQVHPGYQEITIAGNVPEVLLGEHQNCRSVSFAGCINHAVDLLVAHRFGVDLDALFLQISGINHVVHLDRFLSAGGFDEALLNQEESTIEFRLRLLEAKDESLEYEALLNDMLDKTTSNHLESKLMLRHGKAPSMHETPVPFRRNSPTQGSLEPEQIPMTLCVTFGDIALASQFLKSLNVHCPEGFELHLVACCFGVAANRITEVVEEVQSLFISVKILPESWGHDEGASGRLGPWYLDAENRHGVSWGRCVLHRAAALFSPSSAMWILDDDIEFDAHSLRACQRAFDSMMKQGLQVGIGAITGDAPIPAAYMIRTQVIDFFYRSFLEPEATHLVSQLGQPFHDMHHDLSTSRTDHLEFPLGVHVACRFSDFQASILHGQSISRPTHCEWDKQEHLRPRGGNTLVFGNEPLMQITNMAPKIGGIMCRRGDTMWSKRVEQRWPGSIGNVNLAITQSRTNVFTLGSVNSIRGDIAGSMLSRMIDCETPSVEVFLNDVMNREARLICNLKRVMALLGLMGYNGREKEAVEDLMVELIRTPWPETFREEAAEYLSTYQNKELAFQTAGSVN